MTTPPDGPDQSGDHESGAADDDAVPGHTPADHPGWGSAPIDPGASTPPPPPPPPSYPEYPGASTPPPASPAYPSGGYVPPGDGYPPPGGGYQPPPGQVPPAYGYYGPPAPATSQKAIWSLVTGIAAFCCCITGIIAIVLGIIARQEIKASNGWLTGDGMALGGIITGALAIALNIGLVFLDVGFGTFGGY